MSGLSGQYSYDLQSRRSCVFGHTYPEGNAAPAMCAGRPDHRTSLTLWHEEACHVARSRWRARNVLPGLVGGGKERYECRSPVTSRPRHARAMAHTARRRAASTLCMVWRWARVCRGAASRFVPCRAASELVCTSASSAPVRCERRVGPIIARSAGWVVCLSHHGPWRPQRTHIWAKGPTAAARADISYGHMAGLAACAGMTEMGIPRADGTTPHPRPPQALNCIT